MIEERQLESAGAYGGIDEAMADRGAFRVSDAADLLERPYAPPSFLVQHLIPCRSLVLVSGDSGAGKTTSLLTIILSLVCGLEALGRFPVYNMDRPALYVNGEMDEQTLMYSLHAIAKGLDVDFPRGRLFFEGDPGGFAEFFLPLDTAAVAAKRFETLLEEQRPCLVVFDTMRQLFELDENSAADVRRIFRWLRMLSQKYDLTVIVSHHLRKISAVSNGARERVAGSRDFIGSVDVHLAMKSPSGRFMNALLLDKTRFPHAGVQSGAEWPIVAALDSRSVPPVSTIVAGDRDATIASDADDELRSLLQAEGPMTREQLGCVGGRKKRSFEKLKQAGEIVEVAKDGRKSIYGLVGVHEDDDAIESASVARDRARDRVREKPSNDAGLSSVIPDRARDRAGNPRPAAVGARNRADRSSVPSKDIPKNERGLGHLPIGDRDRDHVRNEVAENEGEIVP